MRPYLPKKIDGFTDALTLSQVSLERIKSRGPIKKEVPGGLPEWDKPRKWRIDQT